jgi:hypothetical protein
MTDGAGTNGWPAVARDPASAAFFDAAATGTLLILRCAGCGLGLGPDVRTCPGCGSVELNREPASGHGTLISWTVVHQPPVRWLADAVPYLTGVVELAEGPWLLVRLVDAPAAPAVGLPVRIGFVRTPGETVPVASLRSRPIDVGG